MKVYNTNIGKVKLRREQFNRAQTKSTNRCKKSLSKRIIAERVDGITKDNIEAECLRLACEVEIDELLAEIMYHIKFASDAYKFTFNEDRVSEILNELKRLRFCFIEQIIDEKEYLQQLKKVDTDITDQIKDLQQCK